MRWRIERFRTVIGVRLTPMRLADMQGFFPDKAADWCRLVSLGSLDPCLHNLLFGSNLNHGEVVLLKADLHCPRITQQY